MVVAASEMGAHAVQVACAVAALVKDGACGGETVAARVELADRYRAHQGAQVCHGPLVAKRDGLVVPQPVDVVTTDGFALRSALERAT